MYLVLCSLFFVFNKVLTLKNVQKLKGQRTKYKVQSSPLCGKKQDEGREKQCREHTSRHTSPEDGDARRFANERRCHPIEGSLPSSPQIGISIIKKQKERAFSLPGKLPAPYNSRDFL